MSDSKKKTPAKKAPAKKQAAKKAPAKKAPAKKQAAKKAPVKKKPATKSVPAKKTKQTFEAVNTVEAHERMHDDMMKALDAADSIKIDFLDDTRDTIIEWAKEWAEEESSDFVSIKDDKVEINLNAKNGILKRFFKKFFKR